MVLYPVPLRKLLRPGNRHGQILDPPLLQAHLHGEHCQNASDYLVPESVLFHGRCDGLLADNLPRAFHIRMHADQLVLGS